MLDVQNISFSWGKTSLFDDVTFSVAPGEVAALVGANGVGKTTLMKILAGVILPSSGTVLVDGQDAFRNSMRYHRMMGYLPENAPAEPDMSVKSYLTYRAHLKGEMAKKIRHRVQEALSLCGLRDRADARIGSLSQGLRKRGALADALSPYLQPERCARLRRALRLAGMLRVAGTVLGEEASGLV